MALTSKNPASGQIKQNCTSRLPHHPIARFIYKCKKRYLHYTQYIKFETQKEKRLGHEMANLENSQILNEAKTNMREMDKKGGS